MQVLQFSTLFSALVGVFALPINRNATTRTRTSEDIEVLAFANVLEQLESAFYTQALQKFNASDFTGTGFTSAQVPIQQITTIASDEGTHAITLESAIHALGGQIISNCTFNFTSVLSNVETMIAAARTVENVGVSAYLGALTSIADPTLVTAAASILTVEARHQTILNLLSDATSIPQAFDVPLTAADVLAIAGSFVSGCKLGFSANLPLTVANGGVLQAGAKLNFTSPALNGTISQDQLSCKIVSGGANTTVQPLRNCTVPANVTGPVYVWIIDNQAAETSMNATTTNSSTTIAGPALLFANNQPDLLANLVRPGFNTTTGGTMTNSTTSPCTTSANMLLTTTGSNFLTMTGTISVPTYASATPTSASVPQGTTPAVNPQGPVTTTLSLEEASSLLASLGANPTAR